MTDDTSTPPAHDLPSLGALDFAGLLNFAPVKVGIHTPVVGDDGSIVDFRLVWWNEAFDDIRRIRPRLGQSMVESYVDSDEALELARRAWNGEEIQQEFVIDDSLSSVYAATPSALHLSVRWFRYLDYIAEIAQDITNLRAAESQLVESDLELLESWRLQEIAESKQEMARDMHDSIIQRLLAVGMGVRRTLNAGEVSEINRRQAEAVVRNLDEVILELRSIVDTLTSTSPPVRAEGRLDELLLGVIDSMVPLLGHHPGFLSKNQCELSDELKYDISAVVRESLANVAKHASATRSFVHIECDRGSLIVRVLDDGLGPDPNATPGHGLANLAERAARHGGTVDLAHRPDRQGGRLRWSIPCPGSSTP